MRKKLIIGILSLALISCGGGNSSYNHTADTSAPHTQSSSIDVMKKECDALYDELKELSFSDSYENQYDLYKRVFAHIKSHGCSHFQYSLYRFEWLLGGKWVTKNPELSTQYFVQLSRQYTDYDNTRYTTSFGTNLKTSKISGRSYYYTSNMNPDGTLTIGYEDTLLEEVTDNYTISFNEDSISLKNLINSKDYVLYLDPDYEKEIKGNAKLAYLCIGSKVFDFKYPSSINVTFCHAIVRTNTVYAKIEAKNSLGIVTQTRYMFLLFSSGTVYVEETNETMSYSNVDLDELNKRIQDYIARS